MDGIHTQFIVHFLPMIFLGTLEGFHIPQHFQNVYPGCKSSQNQSDMSLPECSMSKFLQEMTHQPEYKEQTISTSDIYTCFTKSENSMTLDSTLKGHAIFNGSSPSMKDAICPPGYPCVCKLNITGPPGTFFEIKPQGVPLTTNLYIEDDAGKRPISETLTTKTHWFTMNMTVQELSASFAFSFRAVPACGRRLRVGCTSASQGFIETFGWAKGRQYSPPTNSCVTLNVPASQSLMISLLSIDQKTLFDSECHDPLFLYESSNCEGTPGDEVCSAARLPPRLHTRTVSFGFSAGNSGRLGFRLLFSFHDHLVVPRQLSGGKWDCQVSHFTSFWQHFLCSTENYCSNRRMQAVCTDYIEACGINMMLAGGGCYQVLQPPGMTSWRNGTDVCGRRGGTLAVLKHPYTLKKFKEFPVSRFVHIGLKSAPQVTSLEMYQNTWFWSDDTLAVYLHVQHATSSQPRLLTSPYCASLYQGSPHIVPCELQMEEASFLCKKEDRILQSQNATKITIARDVFASVTTTAWPCTHNPHITHKFLVCDVGAQCMATNQEESINCIQRMSMPVFTCRNQLERVPYTLVCDFRSDCCDGSDEDFCHFSACDGDNQFHCADGKQLIEKAPAVVDFTAHGSITVRRLLGTSCPNTHYQCPGGGYCMPVYTRCNGINDCPGKEDEVDCHQYKCGGYYRCRNSQICLHGTHLCDGSFQCPLRDDELLCSIKSREFFQQCYGYACTFVNHSHVNFDPEVRYLEVSFGRMHPGNFTRYTKLIYLGLRNCGIETIGQLNFPNLRSLDLSHNQIWSLNASAFAELTNLVSLSLAYNPLSPLDPFFHADSEVSSLLSLELSGIKMVEWGDGFLSRFSNLQHLNLSQCQLSTMTENGFRTVSGLRSLDVGGCPMETIYRGVFEDMHQLQYIKAGNYKLCCPGLKPEGMDAENCKATVDEISSCTALLRSDAFRVFLVLCASLSLIGNLGSFIYRVIIEKSTARLGYEVFVTHLSVADFLMGVYLAIIGIADRHYFGDYLWKDVEWKKSAFCKLAGCLSLLSSEVSAFLICLITLERFLVIRFPHKQLRFRRRTAHAASLAGWLVGVVLAVIPLLPVTAHWRFYSQTGICIPLPITRARFPGREYSFAVMILMNFLLFLFIAVGQVLIYWSIRSNTITCVDAGRKARERTVARRLLAVVMTDFLCWFPIGLLGMLARLGVPIPGQVNVAMAIFVLPFNSALNPFLYTLNAIMEQRRNASQAQKYRPESAKPNTSRSAIEEAPPGPEPKQEEVSYSQEEAVQLYKQFLEDGLLTHEQVRRRIWNIYEG